MVLMPLAFYQQYITVMEKGCQYEKTRTKDFLIAVLAALARTGGVQRL
jgi:hypothetical protein